MTKAEKLNTLFDQWATEFPEYKNNFHKDGIVNETYYNKAKKKVLFIMKEPNSPGHSNWTFQQLWEKGLKYLFSYRLADWGYGIMYDFPVYKNLESDRKARNEALWSVSLINLKKSGGGSRSRNNEIYEHFRKNKTNILLEIQIIGPEVIVIGTGSWKIREELFDKKDFVELANDTYIGKWKNIVIIDFYHASVRKESSWLYEELSKVFHSKEFMMLQ